MRAELRWTLGVTLLLTAASLWWPRPGPKIVGAVEHLAGPDTPPAGLPPDGQIRPGPLPSHLEPVALESARRDIFAVVPNSPPVTAPPPPAPKPMPTLPVVAPPEQPTAPPLTLRYLGRMVTPDGRPMVLLARGDTPVTVQPGMMLDEGYRVLRITPEAVRLVYPPTGGEVDIPIPPAPSNP